MNKKLFHSILWAAIFVSALWAYDVDTDSSGIYVVTWDPGAVSMQIKLPTSPTLIDGANFASSVQAAMQEWNAQLGSVQFTSTITNTTSPAPSGSYALSNNINEIVMDSQYNSGNGRLAFDSQTLAVTLSYSLGDSRTESDIVFNTAWGWDSYRTTLSGHGRTMDIRRVAIHELGHVLGLNHPDQANPKQNVTAIMNSQVSDISTMQSDDIAGVQLLYGVPGFIPANNDFANATTITLSGSSGQFTGTSVAASKQSGEPIHAGANAPNGHSVWWKWTAPGSGTTTIDTLGSNFDTVLAVYTGSVVSALSLIVSNDDAELPVQGVNNPLRKRTSIVTFNAIGGTTYFIAVEGWGSIAQNDTFTYAGAITLNLSYTGPINTTPAITTQPISQTVVVGNSVNFIAAANGIPSPTFQWKKNGVSIIGATNSTYTITGVVSGDAGNYTMVATNTAGSATSNPAVLTVNVIPVFSTHPQSLPAFVGSTVSFVAAASGSSAITYQWQKGGVNIPGATGATLTLNNIQLADAASYAVLATDVGGTATSRFARLVVLVAQSNAIVYATTVSSTSVTAGGKVNLAYFMTNIGTQAWGANHYLSIRDINNNFVGFATLIGTLPGETTTAILNFPAPSVPGTYTYYVQALENGVQFFSNQTTLTLTVLAPLANSITYNTTTFPVSAAPGSNVVFTYNVTNTGTQTWGANHLLSLKNSSGITLSSALLTVLAPGASKTVNLSFTAPTTPGTYTYTVQALQTGVGNFNTHADLTLVVLAPRPNAIVYTATRLPDEVVPGAALNLSYSLSNAGTQAWGASHFASLRDENGTLLSFIPLSGVALGGTINVAFSFTAPTAPGLHTYYVQAFEDGIEFFATQDVVVIQVDALPLRNAITYNTTTFPATIAPGAIVSFTYNVTNRGTKTWGATDYLSFRDVDNTFLGFPSISGVAPGASKSVNISFTAPTTPGIYTYKAQGLEDGVSFYAMDDTLVLFVQ